MHIFCAYLEVQELVHHCLVVALPLVQEVLGYLEVQSFLALPLALCLPFVPLVQPLQVAHQGHCDQQLRLLQQHQVDLEDQQVHVDLGLLVHLSVLW